MRTEYNLIYTHFAVDILYVTPKNYYQFRLHTDDNNELADTHTVEIQFFRITSSTLHPNVVNDSIDHIISRTHTRTRMHDHNCLCCYLSIVKWIILRLISFNSFSWPSIKPIIWVRSIYSTLLPSYFSSLNKRLHFWYECVCVCVCERCYLGNMVHSIKHCEDKLLIFFRAVVGSHR